MNKSEQPIVTVVVVPRESFNMFPEVIERIKRMKEANLQAMKTKWTEAVQISFNQILDNLRLKVNSSLKKATKNQFILA